MNTRPPAPLSIKIVKAGSRWCIDSACPNQWAFSGPWGKQSYATRREAMEVVDANLACEYYPEGTAVAR